MAYVGTPIDTQNQFQSLQGKRFSGDASTTAFTLDIAPNSVFDIEVFVENVRQDPNSAYSLNGTTLTFGAAPPSGTNNIYVIHQAKAVGTISPTSDSVVASSIADEAIESEHLNNNIISGQTALAANPATDDELLISDAGTIKRIDAQFFQNTPAFEAYLGSDQTISNNTTTKIQYNVENYDSDSAYDNSTNYRFTPQVAGKYFVYARSYVSANADSNYLTTNHIYKNGSQVTDAIIDVRNEAGLQFSVFVYATVTMNGSSDYVEAFSKAYVTGGTITVAGGSEQRNSFGAYKIIGA